MGMHKNRLVNSKIYLVISSFYYLEFPKFLENLAPWAVRDVRIRERSIFIGRGGAGVFLAKSFY